MKHIKKVGNYVVAGSLGALVAVGLAGCDNKGANEQNALNQSNLKGAMVIIEQNADGGYKILEEYPAAETRVIVREKDGTERILSQEEMDALMKEEEQKIDNGTSSLTNPQMSSGMPGLGSVLLSSIAGAMIGSWIGNKLFNNQNYQNQRRTAYKNPQAYSKSQNSFSKAGRAASARKATSSSSRKSGFFGSKSRSSSLSTRRRSSFGG